MHAIFESRCTINGKVCEYSLQSPVQGSEIEVRASPNPVQDCMVMKGTKTTVNETCTFSFSIGKTYQDQVTCHVIDMDV